MRAVVFVTAKFTYYIHSPLFSFLAGTTIEVGCDLQVKDIVSIGLTDWIDGRTPPPMCTKARRIIVTYPGFLIAYLLLVSPLSPAKSTGRVVPAKGVRSKS